MKEYKRFTERVGKGVAIKETSTNDNRSIWNAIERLAELEDKIENGTLIELPCKVGTIVHKIYKNCKNSAIADELVEQSYRKIDKDSVVLSREEYEKYTEFKKRVDGAKFFEIIENERKETAEKVLNKCDEFYCKYVSADFALNVFTKWLKEQFGVEIKEKG